MAEKILMQQAWGATGKRMLEVESLRIGPLGELLEWPRVIGSWIMVHEPVLLLLWETAD